MPEATQGKGGAQAPPALESLPRRQQELLIEAIRRFRNFAIQRDGKSLANLTTAWTGLGSATTYKPAVDAGLMECATQLNPGYSTWWRLTDKGAEIVFRYLNRSEEDAELC